MSRARPKGTRLTDVEKYAIHGMLQSGLTDENIKALLKLPAESTAMEDYLAVVDQQKVYNKTLQVGVLERLIQGGIPNFAAEALAMKIVSRTPRKKGLAFEIEVDELYRSAIKEAKDNDLLSTSTLNGQTITAMNQGVGLKEAEKALETPIRPKGNIRENHPDIFVIPKR